MRTIQGWVLSHLLDWGKFLTAAIVSDLPWENLPLRRSRSSGGKGQIFYTTALFPWLAKYSGIHQQIWEQKTIEHLPHWIAQHPGNASPEKTIALDSVRIIEGFGLEVGVSAIVLGQNLQEWIDGTGKTRLEWNAVSKGKGFPVETVSDRAKLLPQVCALSHTIDRCDQLNQLAWDQNWWSPGNSCPWNLGLTPILDQDKTARSLLELWLDLTYALGEKPRHLITGLPRFLEAFETFDRAHAFGGLSRTLNPASLECYGGLIAATGALLRQTSLHFQVKIQIKGYPDLPDRRAIEDF